MKAPLDREHLAAWIGREEVAEDLLTEDLSRRFHATLDQTGDAPAAGEAAHPLIYFCMAQPAAPMSGLGEDGHVARGGFLPPVPLPRRMWASSTIAFHRPIRVGEAVRRTSTIADLSIKEGRSGTLCFVTVAHRWLAAGGLAVEEQQAIVYRDAPEGKVPIPTGEPAPQGAHSRTIAPSPTLLFRYSALTFNGHRIHYDRPYAEEVENYPGLVVHGPLQATLLMSLALEAAGGARPTRFSFRGNSPAFDLHALGIHGGEMADGAMKLWTAREGGPIALTAEAHWA